MELIVCFFLASLITGFRPVSDLVHLAKGQEPPHLAKARLRAETNKLKLAAKQAKAENRAVRPADGKPTIGDVIGVYWGDALADVIASHDRRRAEKQAQQQENQTASAEERPAEQVRPGWKQRLARGLDMLIRPVGDDKPETPAEPGATATLPSTRQTYRWSCGICQLHGPDRDHEEDAENDWEIHNRQVHNKQAVLVPQDPDPIPARADENQRPAPQIRRPDWIDDSDDEGDDMTNPSTSPAATGDAYDVESGLNECGLLGDDLTRIDVALDVIDEAITSASAAAEKIEAFLKSKNVDDAGVGGMAVARDMLSAERIKSLIDAIAAAKAGVQAAEAELQRLQELESQLNGADGSVLNGR